MTAHVRWTQRAAARLENAALHFESVRDGLGGRLIDDVEDALERAATHPMSNPRIPGEAESTRKAVLPRFGYWVIYEIRSDEIIVLTIWSAKREPGSWVNDRSDTGAGS